MHSIDKVLVPLTSYELEIFLKEKLKSTAKPFVLKNLNN